MNVLVTGGAGFIGRWLVKRLLDEDHKVWILDNLSNGSRKNIEEFYEKIKFIEGDIRDKKILKELFKNKFEICFHLAAAIDVQNSIDNPEETINVNINGTFNIMEEAKKTNTKVVFMSSALVYSAAANKLINEDHATWPGSPYSASKIAGENLALSYYYSYSLPVVVIRPFSVYGPFQKTDNEGGVASIFIRRALNKEELFIYGDGKQTRDLFYVEDCADFIFRCGVSKTANGEIINAGSGSDMSINELAFFICKDREKMKYITHHHLQAEIKKMICNFSKAKKILGWEPHTLLNEGIERTREWIKNNKA